MSAPSTPHVSGPSSPLTLRKRQHPFIDMLTELTASAGSDAAGLHSGREILHIAD